MEDVSVKFELSDIESADAGDAGFSMDFADFSMRDESSDLEKELSESGVEEQNGSCCRGKPQTPTWRQETPKRRLKMLEWRLKKLKWRFEMLEWRGKTRTRRKPSLVSSGLEDVRCRPVQAFEEAQVDLWILRGLQSLWATMLRLSVVPFISS